jgi:hypothetical protein
LASEVKDEHCRAAGHRQQRLLPGQRAHLV